MEGKNELQQVCETVLALQKGVEEVDRCLARVNTTVGEMEKRLEAEKLQERLTVCEKKLSGITAELKKISDLTERLEAAPSAATINDKLDRIIELLEKQRG